MLIVRGVTEISWPDFYLHTRKRFTYKFGGMIFVAGTVLLTVAIDDDGSIRSESQMGADDADFADEGFGKNYKDLV